MNTNGIYRHFGMISRYWRVSINITIVTLLVVDGRDERHLLIGKIFLQYFANDKAAE
jgi:hypothetical protein